MKCLIAVNATIFLLKQQTLKVSQNDRIKLFSHCSVTERRDILRCLQLQLAMQNKAQPSLLA